MRRAQSPRKNILTYRHSKTGRGSATAEAIRKAARWCTNALRTHLMAYGSQKNVSCKVQPLLAPSLHHSKISGRGAGSSELERSNIYPNRLSLHSACAYQTYEGPQWSSLPPALRGSRPNRPVPCQVCTVHLHCLIRHQCSKPT